MGSIAYNLHEILPPDQQLSELSEGHRKLQRKLTQDHDQSVVTKMINGSFSLRDASCLRSLQGKGAGAWVGAILSSSKLALSHCNFHLL